MSKTSIFEVQVQFGDCDPAGIVFFPNYSRWMDAASLNFFASCGVPPWRDLLASQGIIGTPLLEINTRFLATATYGETITIHTHITDWAAKTFVQQHTVKRGDVVLCEGRETRAFCVRVQEADKPPRIKAIAVPADIRALCGG